MSVSAIHEACRNAELSILDEEWARDWLIRDARVLPHEVGAAHFLE